MVIQLNHFQQWYQEWSKNDFSDRRPNMSPVGWQFLIFWMTLVTYPKMTATPSPHVSEFAYVPRIHPSRNPVCLTRYTGDKKNTSDHGFDQPSIEVRAVLAPCSIFSVDKAFDIKDKKLYNREERSSEDDRWTIKNCTQKIVINMKLNNIGPTDTRDKFVVIDHAVDPATMKKFPLQNPYVIKLRQEPVLQLYGLKFKSRVVVLTIDDQVPAERLYSLDFAGKIIDRETLNKVVNAEAREDVINNETPNYRGCSVDNENPTCGQAIMRGEPVPFSQGFCCSCDPKIKPVSNASFASAKSLPVEPSTGSNGANKPCNRLLSASGRANSDSDPMAQSQANETNVQSRGKSNTSENLSCKPTLLGTYPSKSIDLVEGAQKHHPSKNNQHEVQTVSSSPKDSVEPSFKSKDQSEQNHINQLSSPKSTWSPTTAGISPEVHKILAIETVNNQNPSPEPRIEAKLIIVGPGDVVEVEDRPKLAAKVKDLPRSATYVEDVARVAAEPRSNVKQVIGSPREAAEVKDPGKIAAVVEDREKIGVETFQGSMEDNMIPHGEEKAYTLGDTMQIKSTPRRIEKGLREFPAKKSAKRTNQSVIRLESPFRSKHGVGKKLAGRRRSSSGADEGLEDPKGCKKCYGIPSLRNRGWVGAKRNKAEEDGVLNSDRSPTGSSASRNGNLNSVMEAGQPDIIAGSFNEKHEDGYFQSDGNEGDTGLGRLARMTPILEENVSMLRDEVIENYTPQKRTLKDVSYKEYGGERGKEFRTNGAKRCRRYLRHRQKKNGRSRGWKDRKRLKRGRGQGKVEEKREARQTIQVYIDEARTFPILTTRKSPKSSINATTATSTTASSYERNGVKPELDLQNEANRQDSVDKQIEEKFSRISDALKEDAPGLESSSTSTSTSPPPLPSKPSIVATSEKSISRGPGNKFNEPNDTSRRGNNEANEDGAGNGNELEENLPESTDQSVDDYSGANKKPKPYLEPERGNKGSRLIPSRFVGLMDRSSTTSDVLIPVPEVSSSVGAILFPSATAKDSEMTNAVILVDVFQIATGPLNTLTTMKETVSPGRLAKRKNKQAPKKSSTVKPTDRTSQLTEKTTIYLVESTTMTAVENNTVESTTMTAGENNTVESTTMTAGENNTVESTTMTAVENNTVESTTMTGVENNTVESTTMTAGENNTVESTTMTAVENNTVDSTNATTTLITDPAFRPSIKPIEDPVKRTEWEFANEVSLDDTTFADETEGPTTVRGFGTSISLNANPVGRNRKSWMGFPGRKKRRTTPSMIKTKDLSVRGAGCRTGLSRVNRGYYGRRELPESAMKFSLESREVNMMKKEVGVTGRFLHQQRNYVQLSVDGSGGQTDGDLLEEDGSRRMYRENVDRNTLEHPWILTTEILEFTVRPDGSFHKGKNKHRARKSDIVKKIGEVTGRILPPCAGEKEKGVVQGRGCEMRMHQRRLMSVQDVERVECHWLKDSKNYLKNRNDGICEEKGICEAKLSHRRLLSVQTSKLSKHLSKDDANKISDHPNDHHFINDRETESDETEKSTQAKSHQKSKKRDTTQKQKKSSAKRSSKQQASSSSPSDSMDTYDYLSPEDKDYDDGTLAEEKQLNAPEEEEKQLNNPEDLGIDYENDSPEETLNQDTSGVSENLQDDSDNLIDIPIPVHLDKLSEKLKIENQARLDRSSIDEENVGKDFEISLTGKIHLDNDEFGRPMSVSFDGIGSPEKDSVPEGLASYRSPESASSFIDATDTLVADNANFLPEGFNPAPFDNVEDRSSRRDHYLRPIRTRPWNSERGRQRLLRLQKKSAEAGLNDESRLARPWTGSRINGVAINEDLKSLVKEKGSSRLGQEASLVPGESEASDRASSKATISEAAVNEDLKSLAKDSGASRLGQEASLVPEESEVKDNELSSGSEGNEDLKSVMEDRGSSGVGQDSSLIPEESEVKDDEQSADLEEKESTDVGDQCRKDYLRSNKLNLQMKSGEASLNPENEPANTLNRVSINEVAANKDMKNLMKDSSSLGQEVGLAPEEPEVRDDQQSSDFSENESSDDRSKGDYLRPNNEHHCQKALHLQKKSTNLNLENEPAKSSNAVEINKVAINEDLKNLMKDSSLGQGPSLFSQEPEVNDAKQSSDVNKDESVDIEDPSRGSYVMPSGELFSKEMLSNLLGNVPQVALNFGNVPGQVGSGLEGDSDLGDHLRPITIRINTSQCEGSDCTTLKIDIVEVTTTLDSTTEAATTVTEVEAYSEDTETTVRQIEKVTSEVILNTVQEESSPAYQLSKNDSNLSTETDEDESTQKKNMLAVSDLIKRLETLVTDAGNSSNDTTGHTLVHLKKFIIVPDNRTMWSVREFSEPKDKTMKQVPLIANKVDKSSREEEGSKSDNSNLIKEIISSVIRGDNLKRDVSSCKCCSKGSCQKCDGQCSDGTSYSKASKRDSISSSNLEDPGPSLKNKHSNIEDSMLKDDSSKNVDDLGSSEETSKKDKDFKRSSIASNSLEDPGASMKDNSETKKEDGIMKDTTSQNVDALESSLGNSMESSKKDDEVCRQGKPNGKRKRDVSRGDANSPSNKGRKHARHAKRRKRRRRKMKKKKGARIKKEHNSRGSKWPLKRNLLMLSEDREDGSERKGKKGRKQIRKARDRNMLKEPQTRGGQDCGDHRYPPDVDPFGYLQSAHCLRFSKLWYSVYQLDQPVIDHKLHLQIYEKRTEADGTIYWKDLATGSSIRLGTLDRNYRNLEDTMALVYNDVEVKKRWFDLDHKNDRLLVPSSLSENGAKPNEDQAWLSEYLVLQASQINENADECDKAGVGYTAFVKQPDRCEHVRGTCLKNQPLVYWRHDTEARDSGLAGCYFLSNFAGVPAEAIKYNANGTGSREFLGLEYHSPHVSVIDVELTADYNALLRPGSFGRLTEVSSYNTGSDYTVVTALITNKGSYSSSYRLRITDCPEGVLSSWSTVESPMRIVSPHRDRKISLDLYSRLSLNEFSCSVALLNRDGEPVASRQIKVRKMDRCFCVRHCKCVCEGNTHGDGCEPMSLENYHAAGFHGTIPSMTYDFFTHGSPVNVVCLFLVGLLFLLLLMGFLKWLIGLCVPTISRWGLDAIVDSSQMKIYFEKDLTSRPIVFDQYGTPIHPDTQQKTVRVCSRKLEFLLNLIFFFIYPFASCQWRCKKNYQPPNQVESNVNIELKSLPTSSETVPSETVCVSTYGDSVNSNLEAEDTRYVIDELKKSQESLRNHCRYKRDSDSHRSSSD